jgi:hypothetical protein
MAKRSRELAKQAKRKEKEERRAQRKTAGTGASGEEDPDLAGIIPGPQPPLMDSE